MFDQIAQTIPYQQITVEGFEISIKRLDLVHPQISGNLVKHRIFINLAQGIV